MTKRLLHIHHRKPRSLGGTDDERNLIGLPRNKHDAWHLITRQPNGDESTPEQIAQILNYYLDPDYEFIVRRRK